MPPRHFIPLHSDATCISISRTSTFHVEEELDCPPPATTMANGERERRILSPRKNKPRNSPTLLFSLPLPLLAGLLPASILPATLGSPFHPGHNAKIARRLPHCPAHRHLQNLQNWKNAASQCLYYMCERVYTRGWGKGGREKSEDTVDRYSNEPFVPARSLARRSRRIHRERWQRWQWWQWWVWRTWSLSPSLSPWLIQWSSREAVDSCSLSPVAPPPSRSKITRIDRSFASFENWRFQLLQFEGRL